jgi:hypothetical protein
MANEASIPSLADSLIHPPFTALAGRSRKTGVSELLINLPGLERRYKKAGRRNMKKFILFVAAICALGAFVGQPSADASRHAARDTLSPLAMMQVARDLPIEAYQAI